MTLLGEYPHFSDADLEEIRRLAAERWAALDRQRHDEPSEHERALILSRQHQIERLQEKL